MEKRGVLPNETAEVIIKTGALKGQRGTVKESRKGTLKIALDSGPTVEVDEGAVQEAE